MCVATSQGAERSHVEKLPNSAVFAFPISPSIFHMNAPLKFLLKLLPKSIFSSFLLAVFFSASAAEARFEVSGIMWEAPKTLTAIRRLRCVSKQLCRLCLCLDELFRGSRRYNVHTTTRDCCSAILVHNTRLFDAAIFVHRLNHHRWGNVEAAAFCILVEYLRQLINARHEW